MASQKDFFLKKLAFSEGFLTKEQIDSLFSLQESYEKDGTDISIEELIIHKELMTVEQLEILKMKVNLQMSLGDTRALPPINRLRLAKENQCYHGYELLEEFGHGFLGKIFKANDIEHNRKIVLKELSPQDSDLAEIEKFVKEIEKNKELDHPNIAKIYEIRKEQEKWFYTMELIDGQRLDILMKNKKLAVSACVEIIKQAAMALHYAHERGVYHRNLTPKSIYLDSFVEPLIVDFGLAKVTKAESGAAVTGNPHYISPEQANNIHRQMDAVSDVFSLGIILYEMITGQKPFTGKNLDEVIKSIQTQNPLPPSKIKEEIPKALDKVCLKALEEREYRYPNMLTFARDLDNFLQGKPVTADPRKKFWFFIFV